MSKLKNILIGPAFLLFLMLGLYRGCVATSNEIGFLGGDKVGRQIMIQSWDSLLQPKIRVTTEFYDSPYLLRLFQEPMRTTIRFQPVESEIERPTVATMQSYLSQPAESLIAQFNEISLQAKLVVTREELLSSAKEKSVKTIGDLLGGFGFKTFEVFLNGKKTISIPIAQKSPNIIWVGADK